MRRQLRRQRCRLQGPLALDEQRLADARLQHGKRPADSRLSLTQGLRAATDRARVQHGSKLHEMGFAQFHTNMV